jgi:Tol biopolymer transport system component
MTTDRVMATSYSVMPITHGDTGVLDFSPDSKRVVYLDLKSPQNVRTGAIGSGAFSSLTRNQDPHVRYFSPKFSRDGKQIAFLSLESAQDPTRKPVSRVHTTDGDAIREIFSTTDGAMLIGWSSTGDIILATAKRTIASAPLSIELIGISASGASRKVSTCDSTYARTLTMSADGRTVAFTQHREERDDIWTLRLMPGATPKKVTSNVTTRQFLTNLNFSPDGKTILYDKQEEINIISMFENFN